MASYATEQDSAPVPRVRSTVDFLRSGSSNWSMTRNTLSSRLQHLDGTEMAYYVLADVPLRNCSLTHSFNTWRWPHL